MQKQNNQEQFIAQTIAKKQHLKQVQQEQQRQYSINNNFQNPYFRFLYSIHSEETKKRYPDRFKTFLDYLQVPGRNIEERLLNFHNQAK